MKLSVKGKDEELLISQGTCSQPSRWGFHPGGVTSLVLTLPIPEATLEFTALGSSSPEMLSRFSNVLVFCLLICLLKISPTWGTWVA